MSFVGPEIVFCKKRIFNMHLLVLDFFYCFWVGWCKKILKNEESHYQQLFTITISTEYLLTVLYYWSLLVESSYKTVVHYINVMHQNVIFTHKKTYWCFSPSCATKTHQEQRRLLESLQFNAGNLIRKTGKNMNISASPPLGIFFLSSCLATPA
jgi:hypothetical protein